MRVGESGCERMCEGERVRGYVDVNEGGNGCNRAC